MLHKHCERLRSRCVDRGIPLEIAGLLRALRVVERLGREEATTSASRGRAAGDAGVVTGAGTIVMAVTKLRRGR